MKQTIQYTLFMRTMRSAVTLLVVMTTFVQTAWAGPIDETEALKKAQAFLTDRGRGQVLQQKGLRRAPGKGGSHMPAQSDYYVFNVGDEAGFVVVSGDDRTEAILGYADSGCIDEDNMPDGLRSLLDGFSEQLAWLDLQDGETATSDKAAAPRKAPARMAISPLIRTRWNQGSPYNLYCPEINSAKTVTGCVATSMAQLMYFYQWPQSACTAIPGYSTTTKDENKANYELNLDGLTSTTFDWNAMTTTYNNSSSNEAKVAVAKLMQYCGWSLQMKYGLSANGGSSAYNVSIAEALKEYFGYDSGIRSVFRQFYTYQDWVSLIYSELAASRPVVLGGQSIGGGHSFVCDGYDTGDYFHINWGWGGSSDGYFRLSALNPYEQGVGGSSTLDGFSCGQEAVIGIQTPTGNSASYCLSLERCYLTDDPTASHKEISLDNETNQFTFSLDISLFSYRFGTYYFDMGIQLIDEEGNTVEETDITGADEGRAMSFNIETPVTISYSLSSSQPDGTYYLKVVSKPHDTDEWQECAQGDHLQITAVKSGDQLYLTVPLPQSVNPASATFIVNGNQHVGNEQEVIASVTGGSADYRGNLYLCVGKVPVMGKMVEIPAAQTVDVRFTFTPSEEGETKLYLSRARSANKTYVIDSTTVTIQASDASNLQDLNIVPTITNLSNGKLYGNAMRVTAVVSNTSTDNSYAGQLNCSLRTYNNSDDNSDDYTSATVHHQQIAIPRSEDAENLSAIEVSFAFDGLEVGKFYRMRFSYTQGSGLGDIQLTDPVELGEGYALYAADGTTSIYPPSATIDAGSAVCVDLTGISHLAEANITTSTNPNCLYLLTSEASAPTALTGKNVVNGTSAAAIALTDGYDFYTPKTITADAISYTRTFTLPANGSSGWSTIVLPFSVSRVTCEDLGTVDWFHSSSDTGKNFWLRHFDSDGEGYVEFDNTTTLTANTPYIIAVPGDRWGDAWRMTDRAVTFSGTDAVLSPANSAATSGNNYKFCGTTVGTSLSDVYLLNNEGSSFVYTSEPITVPAFRAWFDGVSISSLTRPLLSIGKPQTNDIDALEITEQTPSDNRSAWFTLDGRPLSGQPTTRGLYIHQGKTIFIR